MSGPYRTMIKIVLQKSSALFEELIILFFLVSLTCNTQRSKANISFFLVLQVCVVKIINPFFIGCKEN